MHLGCARNLIDSELILARLAEQGLVVTGDPAQASTVVLNTCSFIGPAREESYAAIEELVERKRGGELQSVVVAGCLVQRYKRQLATRFPDVDVFAEISDYRALARTIHDLSEGRSFEGYLEGPGLRPPERDEARLLSTPASYAYLRISHGCDHGCSFCAIPAIRGPHRSKRPAAVIEEARELIEAGVKELVLVAEDSTAWGRDLGLELPALIESLAELEGEHRLRVMYAYPNHFPWPLATLLRDHPRVLPYLDIPVQHISTPVLRAMRRAGSGDQVRRLLDRLREEVPAITLRTTVLVGFPGETDADVAELVDFVESYELARLGAFRYSPEEGTPGFDLDAVVPESVARERQAAVLEARDRVLAKSQERWVGRTLEVLVDEVHSGDSSSSASDSPDSPGAPGEIRELIARTAMDAPEVDLVARVQGVSADVGDRREVCVRGLDEEYNLLCGPPQTPSVKERQA